MAVFQLFFGLIRYSAGCEDHPTASVFIQLYRLLSVYSLLRLPKKSTSVESSGISLPVRANKSAESKRSATVALAAECLDSMAALTEDDNDTVDELDSNFPVSTQNIIYYVAGYVVRHCRRVVNCDTCLSALTSKPIDVGHTVLINVKLRGALNWPSEALFAALRTIEAVVVTKLAENFTPFAMNGIIEDSLPAMLPLQGKLCAEHRSWLSAEIAVYYAATRLHWHAKAVNKEAASRRATKNCRKKAKLC